MIWWITGAAALSIWLGVLTVPAQPHRTRERLEPGKGFEGSLADVTVLIPARNEADVIHRTLQALQHQGAGLEVIVIDDHSEDATAAVVEALAAQPDAGSAGSERAESLGGAFAEAHARGAHIRLLRAAPLPSGWGGKLWALEQGLADVRRTYTLLLDADIELAPGVIGALLVKARAERLALVSIMARLRCRHFWERMLVPAFVFFFKLLYPFAWVNDRRRSCAAAAGGCVLAETAALREAGAFAAMREALIDDVALAGAVKRRGRCIWLGLSESVVSSRAYPTLAEFWGMVSRTAFTQLNYSSTLLMLTSLLMALVLFGPVLAIAFGEGAARLVAASALGAMWLAYAPIVRFYGLPLAWVATLPVAAVLFLAMTWASAINYWRGTRAAWKNRVYEVAD